jgi:organic hydroperoxide reductase OsmC/OhrA
VRGIELDDDAIAATAEGVNEMVGRIPTLTGIRVHYELRLPVDAPRDKVDRALATHVEKCPTAVSLKGAVEVSWTADIHQEE